MTQPWWFKCRVCGKAPDAPMIERQLWVETSDSFPQPWLNGHDLLCTACVEKAMGRPLTPGDLFHCLGNSFTELYAKRMENLMTHALERTSPKGEGHTFIGRCTKCGEENLGVGGALVPCPKDNEVSDEQALLQALEKDNDQSPQPR